MKVNESLQRIAENHWAKTDPLLCQLSRQNPLPPTPSLLADGGFATLVLSIIHQQVSMAAARTIQAKVTKLLGGKVTPRRILNRSPEALRQAGLSHSKAGYILDLADKTLRGDVEFARFNEMADEDILAELTAVKGIGDWTAKMFLMFHLQRPDVLPHEDLGLRLAVQEFYGIPVNKAAAFMQQRQPAWSPYCSIASRVLWHARRATNSAKPKP
jgi:DNA-3-methyladenine glycosylase II